MLCLRLSSFYELLCIIDGAHDVIISSLMLVVCKLCSCVSLLLRHVNVLAVNSLYWRSCSILSWRICDAIIILILIAHETALIDELSA